MNLLCSNPSLKPLRVGFLIAVKFAYKVPTGLDSAGPTPLHAGEVPNTNLDTSIPVVCSALKELLTGCELGL